MSDIVERLRVEGFAVSAAVAYEAANEIERLRVKVDTLQFLVNQRDIDIEGYKARLAEADALLRESCEFGLREWCKRRDAYLARTASQPTAALEAMVTYHGGDARQRFRQRKCDPLPIWAQDVRDETTDNGSAR